MTSLSNNGEGGSNGTTVTSGNSGGGSGTAWDTANVGTNATNAFDSGVAMHGLSYKIQTGGTSATAYLRWNAAVAALWASGLTTHYGRFYVNFQTIPGSTRVIVGFDDPTVASTRASIACLSTGALRLRNSSNGTVATFTTILSTNTWYRVEYRIDGATSGAYDFRLYVGDNASAAETITGGTANFGGVIGAASYGYTSAVASLPQVNFDDITLNDTGLPGPASAATTYNGTATLSAAGSATAAGTPNAVGAAALTGSTALSASGTTIATGAAALDSTATLAASGTVAAAGTASLGAQSSLTASGVDEAVGSAALQAQAQLAASGVGELTAVAQLSAVASIAASGILEAAGQAGFSSVATLTAAAAVVAAGTAALSATSTLTVSGEAIRPPISGLVETFSSALDSVVWDQTNNPGVVGAVNAGRYEFTIAANAATYSQITTVRQYRLTDSRVVVRLAQAGNQSIASLEAYPLTVEADSNNKIFWDVAGGFIGAYQIVGGVQTGLAFTAYDPGMHVWFRISEASGTTAWATSADGSTWTPLTSTPTPIDVTSVRLTLRAGEYAPEPAGATLVAVDDVNNVSVSGSAALSAACSLAAVGYVIAGGSTGLSSSATLQGGGAVEAAGGAALVGGSNVTAAGTAQMSGAATLSAAGSLAAAGSRGTVSAADLAAMATLAAVGQLIAAGGTQLSGTCTLTASGTVEAPIISVPARHLRAYSTRPRLVATGNDP